MVDKPKERDRSWKSLYWSPHKYNERTRLQSGTYLRSFCPHCDAELTEGAWVHFEVIGPDGESGSLKLSAYLNVHDRTTEIKIPEGEEVKDLRCPHCHHSLRAEGRRCALGDAHVATFLIGVATVKVPFFICMRAGCPWHAIDEADRTQIVLDDSDEW